MANSYDIDAKRTEESIKHCLEEIEHFVYDLKIEDLLDNMLYGWRVFERIHFDFDNIVCVAEAASDVLNTFKYEHCEEMDERLAVNDAERERWVEEMRATIKEAVDNGEIRIDDNGEYNNDDVNKVLNRRKEVTT